MNNPILQVETKKLQFVNNCLCTYYGAHTIVTSCEAVIETTECLTQQKHLKLHALLPDKVKYASDSDLRLSLISLKNTQSALGVHVTKIEKELSNRGVSKYIIHQERDT